jgi:hypothetical protein
MIESMAIAGAEAVNAVAVTMAADALVMSMTLLDDSANTRVNTILMIIKWDREGGMLFGRTVMEKTLD